MASFQVYLRYWVVPQRSHKNRYRLLRLYFYRPHAITVCQITERTKYNQLTKYDTKCFKKAVQTVDKVEFQKMSNV